MDYLLYIAALTYLLGAIIMFLVPETWLPKNDYHESISEVGYLKTQPKKGYYRKVFLLTGLVIIAALLFVRYIVL